jgi:hypothetical protein
MPTKIILIVNIQRTEDIDINKNGNDASQNRAKESRAGAVMAVLAGRLGMQVPGCKRGPYRFDHTLNGASTESSDDTVEYKTKDSSNDQSQIGAPHAKRCSSKDWKVESCFRAQITRDDHWRLGFVLVSMFRHNTTKWLTVTSTFPTKQAATASPGFNPEATVLDA